MDQAIDRELLSSLLQHAGISDKVAGVELITGAGHTNRVSVIKVQSEASYVLREYLWPHDAPDLDRVRKEKFLHTLLINRGLPVPRILADVTLRGKSAILMEQLPGERLGDSYSHLTSDAWVQAWRSCGATLRRIHSFEYSPGTHGIFVGDTLQPFEAPSWGQHCMYNLLYHAQQVVAFRKGIAIDLDGLQKVIEVAIPLLNRGAPTLLHNDAHAWNVLIDRVNGAWGCTGWLDWEYAWVGDPTWDLVRMDLWRSHSIGATPGAFYEGYGLRPTEPNRSIYELSIYLWRAHEYLKGTETSHLMGITAMKYLATVDNSIRKIREQVEGV